MCGLSDQCAQDEGCGVLSSKWDICIIVSLAAAYVNPSGCDDLHKTKIRQHPSMGWGVEVTELR